MRSGEPKGGLLDRGEGELWELWGKRGQIDVYKSAGLEEGQIKTEKSYGGANSRRKRRGNG